MNSYLLYNRYFLAVSGKRNYTNRYILKVREEYVVLISPQIKCAKKYPAASGFQRTLLRIFKKSQDKCLIIYLLNLKILVKRKFQFI